MSPSEVGGRGRGGGGCAIDIGSQQSDGQSDFQQFHCWMLLMGVEKLGGSRHVRAEECVHLLHLRFLRSTRERGVGVLVGLRLKVEVRTSK